MDAPGGEEVAIADQKEHHRDGNKTELVQEVDTINTADRQAAVREFVDFTEYLPSDISRTLNILQKMDIAYESHKSELERAAIAMSGAVPLEAITNGPTVPIPPTSTEQPVQTEQPEINLAAPVSASSPPPTATGEPPSTDPKPESSTQLTNGTSSTSPTTTTTATTTATTAAATTMPTVASLFGPPGKILLPNNDYMRMRLAMSQELNRALKAREQALAEAEKMGLMANRHKARAQHIYEKMKQIPIPNQSTTPMTPKAKGTPKDKSKNSGRIVLRATDPGRRTTEKTPRTYKKNREGAPKTERRRKGEDGSDVGEGSARKKVGRTHQSLQKLALLPPLTPDGRPIPPEDMPWNRLLPHELARLRKRMKKNTTWTPSTTMILKELEGLGRGPLNKDKYRHQWEGQEDIYIPAEDGGIGKLAFGNGGAGVGENKGMKLNAAKRKLKEQKAIEGGISLERPEKKPRKKEPTLRAAPAIIPIPTDFSRPEKSTTEQTEPKEKSKKSDLPQRMTTVEIASPSKRKDKRPREPKELREPKTPKEPRKSKASEAAKDTEKETEDGAENGAEKGAENEAGNEVVNEVVNNVENEVEKEVENEGEEGVEKDVPEEEESTLQQSDVRPDKTIEEIPAVDEPTHMEDDDMARDDTHEVDADGDVDVDAEGEPEGDDADAEAEPDVDIDMDAEGEQDTSHVEETVEKIAEIPVIEEPVEAQPEQNGLHETEVEKEEEAEKEVPVNDGDLHMEENTEAPNTKEDTPEALKIESDAEVEKPGELSGTVPEETAKPEVTEKPVDVVAKKETPVPAPTPTVVTTTRKNSRKKTQVDVPPPPPPVSLNTLPEPTSAILTELDKAADNVSKGSTEPTEKIGTADVVADAETGAKAEKPKRVPAKRAKKTPKKNVPPLPPILPDSHMLQAVPPPTPTTGSRQRKSPKKIDVPPPPPPPSTSLPIAIPIPSTHAPPLPTKAPRKERKSKSATPAPPSATTPSTTTLPPIHIPHPSSTTTTPVTHIPNLPHIPIPYPSSVAQAETPTPQTQPVARTTRGSGRHQTSTPGPSIPPPPSPVATNGRGTKRKRLSISHPAETAPSPTEVKRPTKPPPKRRKKGTKKPSASASTDADATLESTGKAGSVGIDEAEEEPVYCICRQVSNGTMVMCDNPKCEKEWFHLGCVGLKQAPSSKRKWYCPDCIATGIDKELEGVDNSSAVGVDALPSGKKI